MEPCHATPSGRRPEHNQAGAISLKEQTSKKGQRLLSSPTVRQLADAGIGQ
jgi:hypothetical protein